MAAPRPHPPQPAADAAPRRLTLLARTPAVIAPGHTFESVTETISHAVLTKKTPIGWFLGLRHRRSCC